MIGKKKRNFAGGIVDRWFRDAMSGLFTDVFNDDNSQIFQYVEALKVRKLVKDHLLGGSSDYHKFLYSLVVLEGWLRKYIHV